MQLWHHQHTLALHQIKEKPCSATLLSSSTPSCFLSCWIMCVRPRPICGSSLLWVILSFNCSTPFQIEQLQQQCVLLCNVSQLMCVSFSIEKWPRDWIHPQAAPAGVLWTGAHVCGCHDIPGLWHCHPVWLLQRFPQSCRLREVQPCPGERGTEGRWNMQSAQTYDKIHIRSLRTSMEVLSIQFDFL